MFVVWAFACAQSSVIDQTVKNKCWTSELLFPESANSVTHELHLLPCRPLSPGWHLIIIWACALWGLHYCKTSQHFREAFPTHWSSSHHHRCPAHLKGGRHQSEPRRQVSYLHRAAQAQPIFQEDGNRNVTNPSVPVWICMLIWSNRPSGDSAREQFNHAIYDSCFPASSVIWECTHAPPGLDLINWLCRRGNVECRLHA